MIENPELKLLIENLSDRIARNAKNPILNKDFNIGVYEIDSISQEIRICLLIELYQASITLTNHLLEKALKLILIHAESDSKQIDSFETMNSTWLEASKIYNKMDLNDTINKVCSKGLIDKEQKKTLHFFRERIRNGYSHSDMGKLFKDQKIPLVMGNFSDTTIVHGEAKIADVPMLQGIAQQTVAKDLASDYFIIVMNVIDKNKSILSTTTPTPNSA
jgi:hypothetical protein